MKMLCKVDNKKNLLYKAIKRSTLHNYLLYIRPLSRDSGIKSQGR